jgi:opacity protein-like surface antigen
MTKFKLAAIVGTAAGLMAGSAAAAPFEFAGFYAGGHFGYMDTNAEVATDSTSGNGLMGGLQAGYNVINDNLMYGVETDISLTNADPDGGCDYAGVGGSCDFDMGPIATLRARIGYASGDFLLFATGGVAAARYSMTSFDGNAAQVDDLDKGGRFGWTAGAGVEYMLGDMMSVKLEYRFLQLLDKDFTSLAVGGTEIEMNSHTIMTGVNWHF